MRFMIIRRADKTTEAGVPPNPELLAAMMKYNEELVKAGIMLAGEGLHPSAKGARVKFSGGKPTVTDGPFTETKELIAGFSMIQVKTREEAIEIVKRWPKEDGDVELEIRQFMEAEDFGDAFPPEMQKKEEDLRAEAAGVAPRLIADAEDIERLAVHEDDGVPALHGWRAEVFGNNAIALRDGKLALALEKGEAVLVKRTA